MNGPTGYNVRYRSGEQVAYATVTLPVRPSTEHHALVVYQALKAAGLHKVEIWRSGERVLPVPEPDYCGPVCDGNHPWAVEGHYEPARYGPIKTTPVDPPPAPMPW